MHMVDVRSCSTGINSTNSQDISISSNSSNSPQNKLSTYISNYRKNPNFGTPQVTYHKPPVNNSQNMVNMGQFQNFSNNQCRQNSHSNEFVQNTQNGAQNSQIRLQNGQGNGFQNSSNNGPNFNGPIHQKSRSSMEQEQYLNLTNRVSKDFGKPMDRDSLLSNLRSSLNSNSSYRNSIAQDTLGLSKSFAGIFNNSEEDKELKEKCNYLQQLLKDKRHLTTQISQGTFFHLERILDEGM